MQATTGDEIIVRGNHVGMADRHGVIVDVRGEGGSPPYMVRWSDGREDLFFPSSDASITHAERGAGAPADERTADDQRAGDQAPSAEPVSTGKVKRKRTMSREEAARLLAALGNTLGGTGDVVIEMDGEPVSLGSPSEVDVELEVKSGQKKVELELEMKWSHESDDA